MTLKKYHLFGALLLLAACSKPETRLETFARINAEVLKNSKAYSTLKEETSTIGHRLTGSENGHKAEEYTYNKFKEYGFDDVQYQDFEVVAWSRDKIAVTIDGDSVKAVTLGQSPVSADVTGELVDMGNGLAADYDARPEAVKGKIAFFYIGILEGSPKEAHNLHRSEKTAIAINHGAIGVVIYNGVDNGVLLTGTASVNGDLLTVPAICIGKEAGFAIREKMKKKKVQAHITMTNKSGPIKARNVIATIKGSEIPEERLVIGGHLDSWDVNQGASDDGTGIVQSTDGGTTWSARRLNEQAPFFVSAYPNAGLPNEFGHYDQTPEEMGNQIKEFLDEGLVNVIGGCCGTTPEHIRVIAALAAKYKPRSVESLARPE